MRPNIQRLGDRLSDRMKRTSDAAVPTTLELGRINGDMSLTVDSLSNNIPKGSYMVSLWLTHDTYFTYNELNSSTKKPHVHQYGEHEGHESGDGAHIHDKDGLHDHRVSSVFRNLEPGDRVLVAWVGHEPVVITVVTSSLTVTTND